MMFLGSKRWSHIQNKEIMIYDYSMELVQINIELKYKVQNIPYAHTEESPLKIRKIKSHL